MFSEGHNNGISLNVYTEWKRPSVDAPRWMYVLNESAPALTHLPCSCHSRFCHTVASPDVMTSFCDATRCHGAIEKTRVMYHVTQSRRRQYNWLKITFFNLLTLTYDVDRRTCLGFYQGQSMYQLWCQYVKRVGRESANKLTDRWRDSQKHGNTGPILLPRPLTREVINRARNIIDILTYRQYSQHGLFGTHIRQYTIILCVNTVSCIKLYKESFSKF